MDSSNDLNIVDRLLQMKSYVICVSGLDQSPINEVVKDLLESFNSVNEDYAIDMDFMHLHVTEKSRKISNRLEEIINQGNRIIIVKSKTFNPFMRFDTAHKVHINISINKDLTNDDTLFNQYKTIIEESKPNKYFNFKSGTDFSQLIDNIFLYLIDDMERVVYGKMYNKLSHKFYNQEK